MFFNFVLLFLGSPPPQKNKTKDEIRDSLSSCSSGSQANDDDDGRHHHHLPPLPRVMCFLLKDEDAYGRETQRAASGALSTCFTILFVFFRVSIRFSSYKEQNNTFPHIDFPLFFCIFPFDCV